ncbi:RES family NAD+ phosphorylase [Lunatibacter salilacus]|uniref:RES family NAD+ phosphorylase n=1 Tax=Lunatibacter salilacus TaxID=2483804 RepID=UPI00131BAB36|nr:RES family NAD+ phosphorylase [Lunatibacter salilacus]
MKAYRLIENIPGRSALGYGLGGGRWNQYGTPMIYCCNVSALNFLEMLSIKGMVVSQSNWSLITLEIQVELSYLEPSELPAEWRNRPYPISTQQIGTMWAKEMVSPVLKVPSCRIPLSKFSEEYNLLINPLHPEFLHAISFVKQEEVGFEVNY